MGGRTNPRGQTPNEDPDLHPNPMPGQSLVEELGGVADDLRQLYTDFGLRPYTVHSVVVQWSGGEPGRGDAMVISETQLLPTPRLVDMKPIRGMAKPAGFDEEGAVVLRQISPRYTEDDIRTLFFQQPLPRDKEGYLEIRVDSRDGQTDRRRFTVKGTPFRDAPKFEWSTRLTLQSHDRNRAGQITDDVRSPAEVQVHRFDEG